jgi:DNA-binding GntR family transcriptional regulator
MMIGLKGQTDTGKFMIPKRKADIVVQLLEQQIVTGKRGPGARLDERALAEEFGVSRTPVREAIRRLAAIGLVKDLGRRGVLVMQLSASDLLDAFLVVAELEGIAARLATHRMSKEAIAQARAANEACRLAAQRSDITEFNASNMVFHNAIIHGSQNRLLQDQLATARPVTFPFRHHISTLQGYMEKSLPEHADILQALSNGDADLAQKLMFTHVNLQGEQVVDLLRLLEKSTTRPGTG